MDTGFWIFLIVLIIVLLLDPLTMILGDWSYRRMGGDAAESRFIRWVKEGNTMKVKKLLARDSSRLWLDDKDVNGMTALMHAAKTGHKDIVQILLDEGADPNKVHAKMTALTLAEEGGHTEIVDVLKQAVFRR
jgi:ankyrin repeat protein